MKIVKSRTAQAIALAFGVSVLALAQSTPAQPTRIQVVIVHIKPDMLNEWVDLQKNELIRAQKKGGIKTRTTYQTVFGNTFEYTSVTPLEKFAQLDGQSAATRALGAEAAARLTAKLSKCLESRQVYAGTLMPDLSNAPAGETPPVGVFTRRRVAPGKLEDYQNFVKTQILPIYKKAGVGFTVARRGLGANNSDFISVVWVSKLADLDAGNPITRALGEAAAAKLGATSAGMAPIIEQVVRRRVPELSY